MTKPFLILSLTLLNTSICLHLQAQSDSSKPIQLNVLEIRDYFKNQHIQPMPDVKDHIIFAGRKTEIIHVAALPIDFTSNNARQLFGKIPGTSIWDNDGSGLQIGIATRGLSPNRSWEFNVRQNGYDISAEVFGYPEAYYSPPMEAVDRIELVRGAASLQYGPQFGGLLNYQLKKGRPDKTIAFETQQTIASYNMTSGYYAAGGTVKKLSYYGFIHYRSADGWRQNSSYKSVTSYLSLTYKFNSRLSLDAAFTRMNYRSQQPGGLTDGDFENNARQSFRARNWLGAKWNVASVTLNYQQNSAFGFSIKSFLTSAQRNSVGYTKGIQIPDSLNPLTSTYPERQVDRDAYLNYGLEWRASYQYRWFKKMHLLAGGIRVYKGNTDRNQLGVGTSGNDFDFTLTQPKYGRSLQFATTNYSAFVEHLFRIGKRIKLTPGLRYEWLQNTATGYINSSGSGNLTPQNRYRQFFLYGIGGEYLVSQHTALYGNYALCYRPITFSELTPSATTEIIDPNLKDARGYQWNIGYRGIFRQWLTFDVAVFYLHYANRIGALPQNGQLFRTNIGTSVSKGIESYVELACFQALGLSKSLGTFNVFASNAWIDARYTKWNNPAIENDPVKSIANKRVENAPRFIHRFGATYERNGFTASLQYNLVSEVFTDAINTEFPNASATIGKIKGYQLIDAQLAYRFKNNYSFKGGVNNLSNAVYATRRATGYPGPGLLPGNPRTFYLTFCTTF